MEWDCPVPGCTQGRPGKGAGTSWNLRWHFAFRHAPDRVWVAGNNWFPCRLCGIQMAAASTPVHEASKTCRYMWACRDQHVPALCGAAALRQRFTAKGKPLKQVQLFKYLGRIIAYGGSDVPVARRQLARARAVWGRLSKVIAKESVPAPVAGMFYQAVVAAVLLYGSES